MRVLRKKVREDWKSGKRRVMTPDGFINNKSTMKAFLKDGEEEPIWDFESIEITITPDGLTPSICHWSVKITDEEWGEIIITSDASSEFDDLVREILMEEADLCVQAIDPPPEDRSVAVSALLNLYISVHYNDPALNTSTADALVLLVRKRWGIEWEELSAVLPKIKF